MSGRRQSRGRCVSPEGLGDVDDASDGCPAPQWQHLQEQGLVASWTVEGRVLRGFDKTGDVVFIDLDYKLVTEAQAPRLRAFDGLRHVPATTLWRRAA